MTRARALALGLTLVASAGGWYVSVRGSGSVAVIEGEGRYRDGRGRCGREGPPTTGAVAIPCTEYEEATNYVLHSQNLGGGGWALANSAGSNPTITDNTSFAPTCLQIGNDVSGCGLQVADRLQVPAVLSGTSSFAYQTGCPNQVHSTGLWVAGTLGGVSETGSIDVYTGGGVNGCFSCTFAAYPNWTWCTANNAAAGTTIAIGRYAAAPCATGDRAAIDVQIWQVDCQDADEITPSIGATAGAAVTRDAGCVDAPTRMVAGMGDSITAANGTGVDPLPIRVASALDGLTAYNYDFFQGGVPGERCDEILARWPAAKAAGATHMFLHCGINDVVQDRLPAAIWADQEALISDALASGIRVRLVKTLNFDGSSITTPTRVQRVNDLKVLQQAWCDAHGLACADPAATMQTGDTLINHTGDFIHPNATGQEQLKVAITEWPQRASEGW